MLIFDHNHTKTDIQAWFIKKPEKKWMPNNAAHHGWAAEKKINIRCAQMA